MVILIVFNVLKIWIRDPFLRSRDPYNPTYSQAALHLTFAVTTGCSYLVKIYIAENTTNLWSENWEKVLMKMS